MRRMIAVASTALLTFFAVAFGLRFAESSMRGLLTAQVTQPQITYLPNSFDQQLANILPGPDGSMWIRSFQNMLRVKPDNTMASSISLGKDMQSVGDGGMQVFGGKIWAELCGVQNYRFYCELSSIAPEGTIVAHRRYDDGSSVNHVDWQWGLFPGPDGFLWAFSEGNSYKVSASGEFTSFAITPPSLSPGFQYSFNYAASRIMSKGGDGNMWELIRGNDAGGQPQNYIVSITPQGISTPYLLPKPVAASDGSCPYYSYYPPVFGKPVLGPDGNIWYANTTYCNSGSPYSLKSEIGKVLPDGTIQVFPVPGGVGIGKMFAGSDGNLWSVYADQSTYGFAKITSQGDVVLTPIPDLSIPQDAAFGTDGNIWFITQTKYVNQRPEFSAVKIGKLLLSSTQAVSSQAPASSSSRNSVASAAGVSSSRSSSSAFFAGNRCGNGILNSGEVCDDGNTDGGDGCSSSCVMELGYDCSGIYCFQVCGDGIRTKSEQCDDNNRRSGDGCSAACLLEGQGVNTATNTATASATCGNGTLNPGETCDDANRNGGDGCSAQCATEDGYSCYLTACAPVCGDGKTKGTEQCDDANRRNGDGCTEFCRLEPGYSCAGTSCAVLCGDGIPMGSEQCDDGNARGADGCFNCRVEQGWYCGGRPSQCYRFPFASPTVSSATSSVATSVASGSPSPASVQSSSASSTVSSSQRSSAPFLLPDWSFNMSSSSSENSSIRFFPRASVTSSSESSSEESSECSEASSSDSSDGSSISSSEESSESSSESSSSVPSCGNGIMEAGEECDAGSLNGTPVSQCDAACVVLKPAASAGSASSSASQIAAQGGGGTNPVLIMFLVALVIIVVGGVIAFVWFKAQLKRDK